MEKPIYDDGTYVVTRSVIATPTRYYPITNATARIRHDPLWLAVGITSFYGAALVTYGDLLTPLEILSSGFFTVALLIVGLNVSLLSIDAIGHPRAVIVGPTKKIGALFRAIRAATTADFRGLVILDQHDERPSQE